jgi:hypothetical protein
MVDIFLSHATADTKLAEKFLRFLVEAIGVREKEIFCSSVEGHGIPLGDDFNEYMKTSIQEPKLVILLMTPRYMESWFCLMELGAAWAKSHYTLPIVVPPVKFSAVSSTLGLKQGWSIDNEEKLNALRDMIIKAKIPLDDRSATTWDKKRTQWKSDLKKLLDKLAQPTNVSAAEYEALKQKLAAVETERDQFEELYQEQQELVEKLKTAPGPAAVKAILISHNGVDPEMEFNSRLADVNEARPNVSFDFYLNVIMHYYNKGSRISSYGDDIDNAVKYNIAEPDHPYELLWNQPRLKKVAKAIKAVEAFIDDEANADFVHEQEGAGKVMDYNDLEFWETNLR